jgi:hypothetical protein
MSGSNSFGFPGQKFPTQETTNSGVYSQQEIAQLKQHNRFLKKDFTLEFLAIAGGGGSNGATFGAGGGGAGGYLNSFGTEVSGDSSANLTDVTASTGQNYYVVVGAGGAVNTSGDNTVFHNHTAVGGGVGKTGGSTGTSGGSGGGGGHQNRAGGAGTTDQGNAGGQGSDSGVGGGHFGGGGGGGAGNNGGNANSSNAGNGGNGLASAITGVSVTRGGGGGGFNGDGSGTSNRTHGSAGSGGGGAGGNGLSSGTANTGGGGGAGYDSNTAGLGGSGVVILSYPAERTITLDPAGTLVASGGEVIAGSRKYIIIESGTGNVSFA